MLIEKKYQGTIPTNKILNEETSSTTDTYSCEYINNLPNDELPIGTIIEYNGDELPSGWKEYEDSSNDVYSTEEKRVGTWINGKPIYRKVIYLGSLPDKTTINIETGLIHTEIRIVKLYGVAVTTDGLYQAPLNDRVSRLNLVENNTIVVDAQANFSAFIGYAVLEYTKTTD